jgi:3'-phosphoadenosine 5'-phosphosulfate sulfotransferase (PAPS reductase)/FAD synthetase
VVAEPFPELRVDARDLMGEAVERFKPRKVVGLFSGGDDSSVLAHFAAAHGRLDAIVHLDTGTALPGVGEFVRDFCRQYDLPLLVYSAGDAFRRMVAKHGVPGPGAHLYPYVWLKGRQIDRFVSEHKQAWGDRIVLLAGARRAESKRRMGKSVPLDRDGAQVWVNPLIDWSDHDMRTYRSEHRLPQSDVAAILHRSGECNCGAFAGPGEREELRSLYPRWFDAEIAPLERLARDRGLPCVWGERWVCPVKDDARRRRLCSCGTEPLWEAA